MAACRQIEAFERVSKKLEIGILYWQTNGHRAPGLGMLVVT